MSRAGSLIKPMADLPVLDKHHSPKKQRGYSKGQPNRSPQKDKQNGQFPSLGRFQGTGDDTPPLLPNISSVSHKSERTSLTGTPLTSLSSSRSSMHQSVEPSSPTKLPNIVKKSSSIGNILTDSAKVRRTTSLPHEGLRADLCRSPSCPTLWSELQDEICEYEQEITLNSRVTEPSVYTNSLSKSLNAKTDCSTKLPSIFGGAASNRSRTQETVRRTQSLQGNLHLSLADAPVIAPSKTPRSRRELATMTSLSIPLDLQNKELQGAASPPRRLDNPVALLLPMKDPPHKLKKSRSKINSVATTPGIIQASEGTSGDSGVSVGRRQSDRSDGSSAAQDGSEIGGGWEQEIEIEVEMDDETQDGMKDPRSAYTRSKKHNDMNDNRETDNRSALSAEKCREWLESVSEDGTPRKPKGTKGSLKMPKIN